MDFKQSIEQGFTAADFWVNTLLSDFSDADLMARPVPDANHIAWQLGHLINSEVGLVSMAVPDAPYAFPVGFKEMHGKSKAAVNDPSQFLTKAKYLEVARVIRQTTLAALAKASDADMDRPLTAPIPFIKRAGDCFVTASGHWLLHAGQWSVVRRGLGKPRMI